MTIMQRAATLAAMTFALAGTLAHSTPGRASDIDRTAIRSLSALSIPTPVPTIADPTPEAIDTGRVDPLTVEPDGTVADADYDSLSEAVAAQDIDDADDEQRCLAGAIYFEARGEPLRGQLAVANVILNRAKSGRFPSDLCGVVKQHGQFSFVRGGEIPPVGNVATYRTALAVAKVAIRSAWESPAAKALYFNTAGRRPGGRLTRIAMIGNHVFYR